MNHYLIYLYEGQVVHISNWKEGLSDTLGRDMVAERARRSLANGPQLLPFHDGLAQLFDEVQTLNSFS